MDELAGGPDPAPIPSGRPAAAAIAIGSLVAVVAMAFHPSVAAPGVAEGLAEITREAPTGALVHGVMIAALGALIFGFWVFAERLGLHRAPVRAGLVAYLGGCVALLGAATISGFVTTGFAASHAGRTADPATAHEIMAYGFHANQALARIGVVGMSVGILFWSLILVRRAGSGRGIGLLGLLVALIPALAMLGGHLHLNVHGMGAVVLVQAIWHLGIAWHLLRGRL